MAARLQSMWGGSVERHRVRSVGAVGPDGLSDGSGKFGKHALGRGRGFNPIESGGKHKSGDNVDFALSGPWPMAKAVAKLSGFEDALVERSADQSCSQAELAPRGLSST